MWSSFLLYIYILWLTSAFTSNHTTATWRVTRPAQRLVTPITGKFHSLTVTTATAVNTIAITFWEFPEKVGGEWLREMGVASFHALLVSSITLVIVPTVVASKGGAFTGSRTVPPLIYVFSQLSIATGNPVAWSLWKLRKVLGSVWKVGVDGKLKEELHKENNGHFKLRGSA